MAVYWKYAISGVYWTVQYVRSKLAVYWKYLGEIEYCQYTGMFLNAVIELDRAFVLFVGCVFDLF